MGNSLAKNPTKIYNQEFAAQLKKKKLKDIYESIAVIQENYSAHTTLNYDEFDDIFGCLLDESLEGFFKQLENENKLEGEIDLYEALSTFIILCGDEFSEKLKIIFQLFDFDYSGNIQENELIMSLQSVIRGLCKFVNICPPSRTEIKEFAKNIFSSIDFDSSKSIDFNEFHLWVTKSWVLQDFLLKYSGTQTKENTLKR